MAKTKYVVAVTFAFSESHRRLEFDTLGEALRAYEVEKASGKAVHCVTITPPDGYGTTWTNPRYLDLTDMGGAKGEDFDRMREWLLARSAGKP